MRERVWVLSLFVVAADRRNTGWEKNLLERALVYGDGCERATIASSRHPAAMRGCARAGFDLRLKLTASGAVSRGAIPSGLGVRGGEEQGLDLAADVDRGIRGDPHGLDLGHMLETACRLLVAGRPPGKGSPPSGTASRRPCPLRGRRWRGIYSGHTRREPRRARTRR